MGDNPLLSDWTTPYALPPFATIEPGHFVPAFDQAMAEHRAEIEAIKGNPANPDFVNTVEALERAGRALGKVASVFYTLSASHTSPELQVIEREMAPKLSDHRNAILLDEQLYARIDAVPAEPLDNEQARVLELALRRFRKAGAALDAAGRARLAEIGARLATLGTAFGQSVLKDEADWVLWLGEGDLDGLPDWLIAAARGEAGRRGKPDSYAITLSRSSVEPFLAFSTRRDLREQAFRGWTGRGEADNWPVIAETLTLRQERAELLGFEDFAAWRLSDQMAKTPGAVQGLLQRVWAPARARARQEVAARPARDRLSRLDGAGREHQLADHRRNPGPA
ncbi:MAG: M3 family metallopeptidase [Pseudomonadota bacterium]